MKKLAFMFVAVAAMSFASCGGQNAANEAENDSIVAEEEVVEAECDTVCADTCCADTVVAE